MGRAHYDILNNVSIKACLVTVILIIPIKAVKLIYHCGKYENLRGRITREE